MNDWITQKLLWNIPGDKLQTVLKARTFAWFNLFLIFILSTAIVLLNVVIDRSIFSTLNLILTFLLLLAVAGLFLLKHGWFRAAAAVTVYPGFAAYTVYILLEEYRVDQAAIFSPFHFIIFILFTALFMSSKQTLLTAFLSMSAGTISYIFSDRMDPAIVPVTTVNFNLAILISSLLAWLIQRINERSIQMTEEHAKQTEKYSETINFLKATEQLASEINQTTEQLRNSASSSSGNAQDQAASVEEISTTIEELSAVIENVDENAKEQIKSVTELSDFLENLTNTTETMVRSIEMVVSQAKQVDTLAGHGLESMQAMEKKMDVIAKGSDEMTGIVGLINDISDRITLLALNASIEAARAGEHGRGFAVVASEVSKLAEQTGNSVRSIVELIESSEYEVESGRSLSKKGVQDNKLILESVKKISEQIQSLATSVKEQQSVTRQVNELGNFIKDRSKGIGSSTAEQKSAASEIVKGISTINNLSQTGASENEELAAGADRLALITQKLDQQISEFHAGIEKSRSE